MSSITPAGGLPLFARATPIRGRRTRSATVTIGLAVGAIVAFALSLSIGDFAIAISDLPDALLGHGDPGSALVVREIRLPRALTGLFAGLGLGLAGAILQSLLRNPLASPDVLGFGASASAAAIFVIVVVGTGSVALLAGAAIGGALVGAVLVYVLAYRDGVSPYRVVLVGIGIGSLATATISYLLTRGQIFEASEATAWLAGSLNSRTYDSALVAAVPLIILIPAAVLLAGSLRALELGDDVARGLGIRLEPARLGLLATSVALTGTATAAAGPIAFVAFVAPPIARRLSGGSGLALPASALMGAFIVLASDVIAQHVFSTEVPVGIVTGVIGGTYLLWLITRSNLSGAGG